MRSRFSSQELPLSGLRSPKLVRAHDYWRDKRGSRAMPSRADLHPEEMAEILGSIMLLDVSYDPLDFRYTLFGSEIAEQYGDDCTGKSVREIQPEGFNDLVWNIYEDALAVAGPIVHRIAFETKTRRVHFERLALPLSGDGSRIDKFLSVSEYQKEFWQRVEDEIGAQAAVA